MKISIICSSSDHPVYPWIERWKKRHNENHEIEILSSKQDLSCGDLLFLISCNEVIEQQVRDRYAATLVLHASDLPEGRGWSPHIWQVIEGKKEITVSLLEAENSVDTGSIWKKENFTLEGHELYDEINEKLFITEIKLMDFALENFAQIQPVEQDDRTASYYRKRTPEDSQIDVNTSIAEQFDLLRVADPERFPAYVDFRGFRYHIKLEKQEKNE